MKTSRYFPFFFFLSFVVSSDVISGPYTSTKNNACPDAWGITDKAIPVIYKTTAESRSPWGAEPSTDEATAKAHIASANAIVTVDGTDLTAVSSEEDLLSIASECLMYRNFEVDTLNYVTPPASTPNHATGWVPTVIF